MSVARLIEEPRPQAESYAYRFGDCRFDPARRLLFRGEEVTPIPERLSVLLGELLAADGGLVTKERLAESIWQHEAVSDGNLAQHVYMLRELGERARDHSYVLSVSGGYRFALPVVETPISHEEPIPDAATIGDALLSGVDPFRNYCQGSFFIEQRTAPAIKRAIEFFDAALRSNPNYVPALIGLARSRALLRRILARAAGPFVSACEKGDRASARHRPNFRSRARGALGPSLLLRLGLEGRARGDRPGDSA